MIELFSLGIAGGARKAGKDTVMMIEIKREGDELTAALSGRLDTVTFTEVDSEVRKHIDGVKKLTLDFAALDYLSSAGLRVLLGFQKIMNRQGKMEIINVNQEVRDVFAMTGMLDIFAVDP